MVNRTNKNLPSKFDDFPFLYKERHIKFGSFARRTKIRPLDDIDLIITFSASDDEGNRATYSCNSYSGTCYIFVPEEHKTLRRFCDENGYLNSRKILEKLKSYLSEIPQYSQAEIHRRQEAVTLKLSFYPWNFDIVPAFFTVKEENGRNYYLIPDGNGNWKKTDPRIDQERVTNINQKQNGKALEFIRLLKHWKRKNLNSISSYLFENIVLNFLEEKNLTDDNLLDLCMFFDYLQSAIYNPVYDPKGIQGNINNLDFKTKYKVSEKAKTDKLKIYEADRFEKEQKHKKAISNLKEVFGTEFPDYE
ncbi:hypothetical protein [Hippea jasoniae]|uniref:hypothetical protein n=1 Tax=Hippea jasoniae TaxID=944479 RepID=UPI000B199E3E|nr:hypothetical protein [Hippea jasoniae]